MKRDCAVCSRSFEYRRPEAKYCGPVCRNRASKSATTGAPLVTTPPKGAAMSKPAGPGSQDLVAAITAQLDGAGLLGSAVGHQALQLARRMGEYDTGGGLASLSRELRAVMSEAMRAGTAAEDPLDELRARRDAKRSVS